MLRGSHWLKALLIAAVICAASRSRADEAPLQLDYRADSGCPDRGAFADLVAERVAGAEGVFAAPPQGKVSLLADGLGFVGQLELVRPDGSHYQREVSGASCTEVANALAFVLALTLTAKEPPRPVEPPPIVPVPPPVVAPPRVPEKPVPKPRSPWDYGVGLQLGARAGLAPEWALVEAAFLEARRTSPGPFGFSARAGFMRAPSVNHTVASGTTEFSWWAARLEGCPVRLHLLEPVALLPCAGMHIGRLTATGKPSPEFGTGQQVTHTWVEAFAGLRLEVSLLRWLSLQAQAELLVPITRFQYVFENPETPIYHVPAIAGGALAGVELRFP